jgi:hypothetical protein
MKCRELDFRVKIGVRHEYQAIFEFITHIFIT